MKKIVLFIVAFCVSFPILIYIWLFYTDTWKFNADFDGCKTEFTLVKDYIVDKISDERGFLWISYEKNFDLYNPAAKQYMNCPDNVRNALEKISKDAFNYKDSVLDMIRYDQDEISFVIENRHYALVYSPSEKPNNIQYAEAKHAVFCRPIEDGWYHVRIR